MSLLYLYSGQVNQANLQGRQLLSLRAALLRMSVVFFKRTVSDWKFLCCWTVMQDRGGMRTTRINACPKQKKMYQRQCKCVVLVVSEKLTHLQLTTVTPHGVHWGLQKKLQCLHYRAIPFKTRIRRYIQGTAIMWYWTECKRRTKNQLTQLQVLRLRFVHKQFEC